MTISQIYVLILIVVLAIIAVLVFVKRKKKEKALTPLAGVAFAFVLGGIVFGANRFIGYGLMGVGIILAIIDCIIKSKK